MSRTEFDTRAIQEEVEEEFSVVGTQQARHDGGLKVSGSAIFGTDIELPNMLHGKIFRSTSAHARIKSLDVSGAENYPGVRAVVTAKDFPEVTYGFAVKDEHVLPTDTVVYYGQPICAIAADTVEIAERAIGEIKAEYEPLPLVLSYDDALRDDSPPIHPGVVPAGAPPYKSKNVATYTRVHRGDVEKAFMEADFVLEETYETTRVHQSYLEPRATVAEFDQRTGRIKIWTATQSPFLVRNSLAEILAVPVSQIQIVLTHTGGAFGAKILTNLEPFCVMLSKKAGRPVKMVLSRAEEFIAATPRPGVRISIKSGVKDGKIIARKGRSVVDCGCYASDGAVYANIAAFTLLGPYNIPNYDAEGIAVYTNKQPSGAYRAPGTMETAFGLESHMDMLAKKAGMGPFEFRMANLWEDGSLGPTGQVMKGVGVKDALKQAVERIGYKELAPSPRDSADSEVRLGFGIACGLIPTVGIHASGSYVKLNEDGKVVVITGATDTGTGALTGLTMIAAEELAVKLEDVMVLNGDTDFAPWDGGAQGSRTTYGAGNAVLMAARDAKKQLLEVAATCLKVDKSMITLKDRQAHVEGTDRSMSYSDLVKRAQYNAGGPIVGRGYFARDFPEHDKDTEEGYFFVPSLHDPTFVAHIACVEVDSAGETRLLKYVAAVDIGRVINPLGAEGQVQGGVTQGIGYALSEEMRNDKAGVPMNPNFTDYKIPTIMGVPQIEPLFVEGHYGNGPYGAKGIGEVNIVPPAPAIANAIFNATGVRIRKLPLNPENFIEAMDELAPRVH
jgi:CO/xanthine dehydrogenase Mo-binding subunit